MSGDSFIDLLKKVSQEGKVLANFVDGNGYYMPAFALGGFSEFNERPPEVEEARKKLRDAAKALHDLAAGPGEYATSLASNVSRYAINNNGQAQRYTCADLVVPRCVDSALAAPFHIPEAIPLRGSISYSQIARVCHVNESHLRRMIRYAITNHLFQESDLNEVSHTAYSAILVTNPELKQNVEYAGEEAFPASAKFVEAHGKCMNRHENTRTAFNLAWDTDLPHEVYYGQPGLEEERIERFKNSGPNPEVELQHLLAGYGWNKTTRLVDVGGAKGETAIALVRKFPSMRIMVEDFPEIIEAGEESLEESLPEDVHRKIFFVGHDLFTPQPDEVSESGVYLLRNVLHRYSDEKAAQILEHLAELLLDDGALIIVDRILPSAGEVSLEEEKHFRHLDLEMLELHNGKERRLDEWEALLRGVDEDLKIVAVTRPEGSVMSIIEVAMTN